MAKCGNITWDSWINPKDFPPKQPTNDGQITIKDVAGTLTGEHDLGGGVIHKKINGKCKDTPDRIHFDSEEGAVTFTYSGLIIELGTQRLAVGCRTQRDTKDKRALQADDDVWVGVKTT